MQIGDVIAWERTFTEDDIRLFAELSGDKGTHHVTADDRGRIMAHGLLTGKVRRGQAPPPDSRLAEEESLELLTGRAFDVIEALERYANDRGISLLDVAIGGLAAEPTVASVIAGATHPDQVRANTDAGGWEPTLEDLDALTAVLDPFSD